MSDDVIFGEVDPLDLDIHDGLVQIAGTLDGSKSLFPDEAFRREVEDLLTISLSQARQQLRVGSVVPAHDAGHFGEVLAGFDFNHPQDLSQLLGWVVHAMNIGLVQVRHPRYFGLFNPTPTFPAECADRVVATFNAQLASATTSPFAVAVERHTIKMFCDLAGLPSSATGHFTSGGSEANFTALQCALTHAHRDFSTDGVRAFAGRPVLLISTEAHLAWIKIAHQAGIGRHAVSLVETDGAGAMCADALRAACAAATSAGDIPVMIVATAGTTAAGMIDPLEQCAAIAREYNIWFHVDAAWGGAALISPSLRPLLAGIGAADSVTIDAHKWLATTMGCGMFLTRGPQILADTFGVTMDCMPSSDREIDPYLTTAQWSRRFLGLRLFVSLAAAGWQGYTKHVEKSVALAASLQARLQKSGWTIVNSSYLAVLCLLPPDGSPSPSEIATTVNQSGAAWVSAGTFEGAAVIRTCITSGESETTDILKLAAALDSALG